MDNNYIKSKFISVLGKRCVCGNCININYEKRKVWSCGSKLFNYNKHTFKNSIAWSLYFVDYTSWGTNLKKTPVRDRAAVVRPTTTLIETNEYIIKCNKCGCKIVKEIRTKK